MSSAVKPETIAGQTGDGAMCRTCGSPLIPPGWQLHGDQERLTAAMLSLLFLIPGLVYYILRKNRPYCTGCKRRV